ncbi:MAG: competence protein ComFB [Clostridiales bacterium]|nr:MAG: competence protein ComFB [Clostridiales bacterium]
MGIQVIWKHIRKRSGSAMKMHNYMEDVVEKVLGEHLDGASHIANCEKCRKDVLALTLNNLPAKYVVTDDDESYGKLDEIEEQNIEEIMKELKIAIEIVNISPLHD